MGAEAAGEQAVAVGDMHDVAGPAARGADRAGDEIAPVVDVAAGVADDGRLAGGAGGSVQAHDLLARRGEHAEGIGIAQVALHREREFGEVFEPRQVGGMDARGVELGAIDRRILVGVGERPAQAVELQCGQFVARRGLDGFEIARPGREILQSFLPGGQAGRTDPCMARQWPRNSAIRAPVWLVDRDVVEAAAAAKVHLARRSRQCVVDLRRRQEGYRALRGDHALVAAVAGESESGIGEGEDEAAVAHAVAVGHLRPHDHLQPRLAGADGDDAHAEAPRGVVGLPHRRGAGFGEALGIVHGWFRRPAARRTASACRPRRSRRARPR